jgi:hypothetical protein
MLTGNDLTLGYHGEWRIRSLGDGMSAHVSRAGTGVSGPISYVFGHHLSAGTSEFDRWDRAMENQRKEHMA